MSNQAVRQHHNDPRRHRYSPSKVRNSAVEVARQKVAEPNERLTGRLTERSTGRDRQSGLVLFLRRYPLALLLVAWVAFMLLAGVAVMDMTSLGSAKPPIANVPSNASANAPDLLTLPSEAPSSEVPLIQAASEPLPRHDLPLFSLGAVALSCALGCLIILQVLKPRRLPERSHSSAFSKSAPSKSASQRPQASDTKTNSRFQYAAPAQSSKASPTVPLVAPSVVPSHITQPLDWEEPSIADHLDIRQKRPLSYWL